MPWDRKIPFERRNLARPGQPKDVVWNLCEYVGYRGDNEPEIQWISQREYKAQLIVVGWYKGRSAARVRVRVIPQLTETFEPFRATLTLHEFMDSLKNAEKVWRREEDKALCMFGVWESYKQGKNFGLRDVNGRD